MCWEGKDSRNVNWMEQVRGSYSLQHTWKRPCVKRELISIES